MQCKSAALSCAFWDGLQAARASSSSVRTDDTLKVRFSATLGEEPEIEVALV
jgi:hypothetical protein